MDLILPPSMTGQDYKILPPSDQKAYLSGNKTCPNSQKSIEVDIDTPLSSRSICPYFYVTTYDPRRYPATITEVECSCKNCVDYNGLSQRNVCEPVYRNVLVISKTECNSNHEWQYELAVYKRKESCTCALPRQITSDVNEDESSSNTENDGPPPM